MLLSRENNGFYGNYMQKKAALCFQSFKVYKVNKDNSYSPPPQVILTSLPKLHPQPSNPHLVTAKTPFTKFMNISTEMSLYCKIDSNVNV